MGFSRKISLDDCLIAIMLVAFYPVWSYCANRWIANDEPAGCLPLVFILFLWGRTIYLWKKPPDQNAASNRLGRVELISISLLLGVYILTYRHSFMLVRAILTVAVLGLAFSRRLKGRTINVQIFGLLMLSLPTIPTVQFYLGYPLRVIVAKSAAIIIKSFGYAVSSSGTSILWGEQYVSVDAPCSGIKMLYTGILLILLAGLYYDFPFKILCLLGAAGIGAIVFGNICRASALFFTETGIIPFGTNFLHTAIGLSVFVWITTMIFVISQFLERRRKICITA